MKNMWILAHAASIVFVNTVTNAELTEAQFVESVGVLYLDPKSLAAAGLGASELSPIWSRIAESDSEWQAYSSAKSSLRSILNNLEGTEQFQLEVSQAKASLDESVANWRLAVLELTAQSEIEKLKSISSQFNLDFPVYLKVVSWNSEEVKLLERGYTAYRHNLRFNRNNQSDELAFLMEALAMNEVVLSKIEIEENYLIFNQAFASFLQSIGM